MGEKLLNQYQKLLESNKKINQELKQGNTPVRAAAGSKLGGYAGYRIAASACRPGDRAKCRNCWKNWLNSTRKTKNFCAAKSLSLEKNYLKLKKEKLPSALIKKEARQRNFSINSSRARPTYFFASSGELKSTCIKLVVFAPLLQKLLVIALVL